MVKSSLYYPKHLAIKQLLPYTIKITSIPVEPYATWINDIIASHQVQVARRADQNQIESAIDRKSIPQTRITHADCARSFVTFALLTARLKFAVRCCTITTIT